MIDENNEAKASQRFEYYSEKRLNFSDDSNSIINKIKDGYDPNEADVFELLETDQRRIDEYRKFYNIRKNIEDNGNISEEDLEFLVKKLNVDEKTSNKLIDGFKEKGVVRDGKGK